MATNIAETSITIDGIVHVIDSGLSKMRTYNGDTDSSQLIVSRISQASAKQRKGRAGRTRPGNCYRLYSKQAYEEMDKHEVPEILRVPLADTCLYVKSAVRNQPTEQFIAKMIEAPPSQNVSKSIEYLKQIGLLDAQENITELGSIALTLPVNVKFVRAIIWGITCRCWESVAIIVSMLSSPPPFKIGKTAYERKEIRKKRQEFQNGSASDLQTTWKIYNHYINRYEKLDFCHENYISYGTMQTAHGIFTLLKKRLGSRNFIHTMNKGEYKCVNSNQSDWNIIHACFTSSFYPNLCISNAAGEFHDVQIGEIVTPNYRFVRNYENTIAIYSDKSTKNDGYSIQNTAIVSPITVILMCGQNDFNTYDYENGSITIGDFIAFNVGQPIFNQLMRIRTMLDSMFESTISKPHGFRLDDSEGKRMGRVLSTIMDM